MPRYFVDFQDGDEFHKDVVGIEYRDVKTARREAALLLPSIAKDELPDGEHRTFIATLRDRDGKALYRAILVFHGEILDGPSS
jgi:hypothetical protein